MLDDSEAPTRLQALHTDEAIADRIASAGNHSYVGDFILGAVDGTVTTFAIVASAAGAGLSSGIAIVLGLANVLADGFSMAAGNYLSARSTEQIVERARRIEHMHIDRIPAGEREEIRQIFAAKGFEGELLDEIVNVITQDKQQWVDTMVTEEWGLPQQAPSATRAAVSTMVAFMVAGMVPLAPLLLGIGRPTADTFQSCAVLTGITFFVIGVARGRFVDGHPWRCGFETLLIGGLAATVAYVVGVMLRTLVGV